ncbi:MAG: hypothetical protein HQK55_08510 [Deltaproteobacteria bacterium]|nr:hypothetical protein [Deltaproteobacteria bacterium]
MERTNEPFQEITITRKHKIGLLSLYRLLILNAALAISGAWSLAGLRLNVIRDMWPVSQFETAYLVLDFVALLLAVFGLLTWLAIIPEFKKRLKRIEALGEKEW